jgi:hypothetical protein
MAVSRAFRIKRIVLAAGVLTPVVPPVATFRRCMIAAAGTDVLVHTNDDQSEYRTVTQGFEREFNTLMPIFRTEETAFWLLSVAGGLVILEWF